MERKRNARCDGREEELERVYVAHEHDLVRPNQRGKAPLTLFIIGSPYGHMFPSSTQLINVQHEDTEDVETNLRKALNEHGSQQCGYGSRRLISSWKIERQDQMA